VVLAGDRLPYLTLRLAIRLLTKRKARKQKKPHNKVIEQPVHRDTSPTAQPARSEPKPDQTGPGATPNRTDDGTAITKRILPKDAPIQTDEGQGRSHDPTKQSKKRKPENTNPDPSAPYSYYNLPLSEEDPVNLLTESEPASILHVQLPSKGDLGRPEAIKHGLQRLEHLRHGVAELAAAGVIPTPPDTDEQPVWAAVDKMVTALDERQGAGGSMARAKEIRQAPVGKVVQMYASDHRFGVKCPPPHDLPLQAEIIHARGKVIVEVRDRAVLILPT